MVYCDAMLKPQQGEPALTVRQVSDRYQVPVQTVRAWIRVGRLRAIKVGKAYRIRAEDIRLFEQETVTVAPKQETTGQPTTGGYEGRGWGDDEWSTE
jgi:excisionase family DNA binding protein